MAPKGLVFLWWTCSLLPLTLRCPHVPFFVISFCKTLCSLRAGMMSCFSPYPRNPYHPAHGRYLVNVCWMNKSVPALRSKQDYFPTLAVHSKLKRQVYDGGNCVSAVTWLLYLTTLPWWVGDK
jgi:hypothetical protein